MSDITVFISYSNDSDEHRERVLGLSERLRSDGIPTILDRYHENGSPSEGWPRWMMNSIDAASHVLCVCTETYRRRFRGHEMPGKGKGADWEGALITQEIYDDRSHGNKFIPVLFAPSDNVHIIEPLRPHTHYLLDKEENYQALYDALLAQAGIEPGMVGTLKRKDRATGKPLTFGVAPSATPSIDITRILKYAPEKLIGRETELARLDAAWNQAVNETTPRLLTFVALGGEGKTSLVAKWAAGLAENDWPGADAVFAWSFYSQGSKDQSAASGELFLREALRFFGDPAMADSASGAHEKGQRLARLVGEKRNLLILDGLEPLQFAPTSPTPGLLKDQGLSALLKGLAQKNAGLCLVTTRYSIDDLKTFRDGTAPEVKLKRLSLDAGVALLRELGITGSQTEFAELVEDVHGHALTLTITGRFLQRAYQGDIRQRDRVKFAKADAKIQGGHAFRAMQAYETWLLAEGGEEGQREVAILHLLGLFDRPADAACLAALRSAVIPDLTEPLADLADDDWEFCLTGLEAAHLLTVNRAPDRSLISLDAHPLLREYFAAQLRDNHPAAWRAAHGRIYEHLCESTKEGDQPSLEDLQPLYQAVAHGCWAGRQQEACDKVYYARISRGAEAYVVNKLGAFASDLGAVACFFDEPWRHLAPTLAEADQAWLLNQTAFRLRALGRLNEALEPMRAGMEMRIKQENWKEAAISASNLSELEVTLGALREAQADGALSVTYAARSGEWDQQMVNRTTHADALQQAGHAAEAAALFREAEVLQAKHQPKYPLLYSVRGFRYGEHLLAPAERAAWRTTLPSPFGRGAGGEGGSEATTTPRSEDPLATCTAVTQRAAQTLQWSTKGNLGLLTTALDHLTLARAALYAAWLTGATPDAACRANLEAAVAGLRRAGDTTYLPRALLTRAWQRASDGDHFGADSAQTDLDEAQEIAERGPMPLFLADIALHRARLFGGLSVYPWVSPAADLATARRLIEKHGYWRRKEELEDAEAWLAGRGLEANGVDFRP